MIINKRLSLLTILRNSMAEESDFYMVLPSDGCPIVHPKNAPHHFRITLDQGIALQGRGQWEVALVELSYVNAIQIFTHREHLLIRNAMLAKYKFRVEHFVVYKQPYDYKIAKEDFEWRARSNRGVEVFHMLYNSELFRFEIIYKTNKAKPRIRFPIYYLLQLGFRRPRGQAEEDPQGYDDLSDYTETEDRTDPDDYLRTIIALYPPTEEIIFKDDIPLAGITGYMQEKSVSYKVSFQPGAYTSMEALMESMNTRILERSSKWKHVYETIKDRHVFQYNKHTGRVHLYLPNHWSVEMKGGLHHILGFKETLFLRDEVAEHAPSVRASVYSIYVYCNIVEVQQVGHAKVRLLRTIPLVPKKGGQTVTAHFLKLRYCPLNTRYIHMIEMTLYNDSGTPIIFDEGKTLAVLHFRRSPSQQLL